jgi:ribosomal protein RSM22 (predicted rRNA methylase)
VDKPKKMSGFVQIAICADGQLKETVVSRKQNEYSAARDAEYGDPWK